jgi:ketosteroid isomerase-like protein
MKHRFLMSTVAVLMIAANGLFVAGQERDRAAASRGSGREAKAVAAIRAVLDAQAEGWNRGDVDAYMDGYMRSPETVLVSGDSVTRGWQVVLDRYKKNYNSREKMGQLAFTEIEVDLLGKDVAMALGRWQLTRSGDNPHGRFTLIFRRTLQGWRIIHDHTSTAE